MVNPHLNPLTKNEFVALLPQDSENAREDAVLALALQTCLVRLGLSVEGLIENRDGKLRLLNKGLRVIFVLGQWTLHDLARTIEREADNGL